MLQGGKKSLEGSILIIYVRFSGGEGVIYSTLLSLNFYVFEMIETKRAIKQNCKLLIANCYQYPPPTLIPKRKNQEQILNSISKLDIKY